MNWVESSQNRTRREGAVIVAHPGTQHSYETALAVQEAKLLRWYVTGFYYKPNRLWTRAVRSLPVSISTKAEKELERRWKDGLDPHRVETAAAAELFYVAMSRMRPWRRYAQAALRLRNEWFDHLVGRIAEREQPAALICYDSCARNAFSKARAVGTLCILDQSIASLRTGVQLLREEAALHPDFADSIEREAPGWLIKRCDDEAAVADCILAGSEYVKKSLVENDIPSSRVVVVPYGVDTRRFYPIQRLRKEVFRILFIGQISQRKGIKYLLEAVKQLKIPRMELVLVGGIVGVGKGLAAYREYFRHIPHVPYAEVHSAFQQGDIFVYPSLHEGSALAIYEALAAGLPVITTPNSGSVVRDGIEGFLVPIRDVEALKEKILLLYENAELREVIGKNARRRAEEFTWQAYRRRMGGVLLDLLENREGTTTYAA